MTCVVCGNPNTEKHHIVFRSQGGLDDADWNIVNLCHDCHLGNDGPHRNRARDLYLKKSLQEWLFQQLPDTHCADKPAIFSESEWARITKNLTRYAEGYKSIDIIRRCMGWKLY
jgi:hypothetical protein